VIDLLQSIGVVTSGVLLLVVLELIRRRRLSEEYSFFWIIAVVILLGLSLRREILHVTARWLGIYYPPMVLVLALVLVVFVGLLYFSVVTSGLRRQIDRLIEEQAILDAELRELRGASPGDGPRAGASRDAAALADAPRADAGPAEAGPAAVPRAGSKPAA
jgi:hypothetical protein